uniref:SWIM-type domain-containing protein n=1 Tax=Lactuca sativa TaxID=4236 RepID=A0A9R1XJ24_LACSA|nr:hypothetical protein LSAT_V11C400224450 [Lactuca sativa]
MVCNGGEMSLEITLWRCATNTTIRHFERTMDEFKDFSAEAHEWLSKIPPVHWAMSHFSGRAHSDCLLNNLCEVFNSKLEHGREKPIITCLEALFCGSGKYQVTSMMFDQYVVNLKEGTCSCRYREITGIVCRHVVCAIWEHIQNGEKAQQPEYWVQHGGKYPINGRSMWPKSRCPTTLKPPTHHTQVGRPKKKRRRAIDEPTNQSKNLSRKFLTFTCSKCHNKGHNSRTCKGKGGQVRD